VRVFKATYKDRKGKTQESAKWYCEFRDHLETVRRLPLFKDRKQTETAGRNVETLVASKINGDAPDKELGRWLESLPSTLREKLARIGLLDGQAATKGKTLAEHLGDFQGAVEAKGNTEQHARQVATRAKTLFDACRFRFWGDVSADKVLRKLAELRADGISVQTSNFYLQAAKQFGKWMVRGGRASVSPIDHLQAMNVATDRRHDRRELSVEEIHRLLRAAAQGPQRAGVNGPERVLLYRLALETGLRANELRSLTRSSFDFRLEPATVTVEAGSSKRRRRDTLPLRRDTAAAIEAHLAAKHPGACAFGPITPDKTARMVREDLADARDAWLDEAGTAEEKAKREQTTFLAYVDDAERYADFHALRHTFLTNLARSGVHPKIAQALARHSTITLTMDRYSHTVLGEQSDAVEALPSLAAATVEAWRATGTDNVTSTGNGVLADSLAQRRAVKLATANGASDAADSDANSVLASCLAFSDEELAVNADSTRDAVETGEAETTPENAGKNGGSAWESNPPAARFTRDTAILKTVATTRCAGTST
jgi:integrase